MASKKLKLLYILEILERESNENHPVSTENIMRFLESKGLKCERKSVYSDIDALKEYGYDILSVKGNQSGYFLASRDFETVEIQLLSDAVESARFISPKKTEQLLEKVSKLTSQEEAKEIRTHCHVNSCPKSTNEEIYYHIDKLSRAIEKKCKIRIQYRNYFMGDGNVFLPKDKEYLLSPYGMIWSNDYYYLIANYQKYDNLMVLRIDRIRSLEIIENEPIRSFCEVSEYTDFFDTADYAKKHFNMFAGESEQVDFVCKSDTVEQVLDKFGDDVHFYGVDSNHYGLSAKIAVNDGLVSWLLQFGDRIEVKKPLHLKRMILKRVKEIQKLYSE